MTDGTILAASAMSGLQRQLELTTKNLANLRTPGFQPRVASARSFESELGDSEQRLVETEETISFEPGVILQDSGNPLAVAISGPGFFQVDTPQGAAYTRSGDFSLDGDGNLVTRGGYPVSGGGGAIRANQGGGEVRIEASGAVTQGGAEIGRLGLTDFADKSQLVAVSDTLFRAGPDAAPRAVDEVALKTESLEYASETSVGELVDMIRLHRMYDASQRVLSSISETYQQRIRSVN